MAGFSNHAGRMVAVLEDNIDTDRIIPARYLTRVTRSGYGDLLFKDVRSASFPLDKPGAEEASILVVGSNFGCGSSREHAVWAIQQAGFKAVISRFTDTTPGFSDIFRQNAANCGLLLIELSEKDHLELAQHPVGTLVTVDLQHQTVSVGPRHFGFEINSAAKEAILNGLDLIGSTLLLEDKIKYFESHHDAFAMATAGGE